MKGLFIKVNLQRSPKCESDKTESPVGTVACHVGGVEENGRGLAQVFKF